MEFYLTLSLSLSLSTIHFLSLSLYDSLSLSLYGSLSFKDLIKQKSTKTDQNSTLIDSLQ